MKAPHARPHWHDAYDAQTALWRWYRTRIGEEFLFSSYRDNAHGMSEETRAMSLDLYRGERGRLLDLDPIYVSREMCEVVAAASESFEPEPLLVTDLITPRGFLYYEHPFLVPDRFEKATTIKAISWQRVFNTGGNLTHEEHQRLKDEIQLEAEQQGYRPGAIAEIEDRLDALPGVAPWGITLTLYADRDQESFAVPSMFPPVVPLHLTPWYFGMSFDGNEVDENGVPTGAAWWWRIVQTTFRLMQQRVASKSYGRPDRASRREGRKLGIEDDREVVVVRLRREASETAEDHEPTEANYSHRFIVSGHWRNQWYATQQMHRQIWISPFVKGPEDKPLIVRPRRVYQWER